MIFDDITPKSLLKWIGNKGMNRLSCKTRWKKVILYFFRIYMFCCSDLSVCQYLRREGRYLFLKNITWTSRGRWWNQTLVSGKGFLYETQRRIQNPVKHLRWLLAIFAKRSILDVWHGSEDAFETFHFIFPGNLSYYKLFDVL